MFKSGIAAVEESESSFAELNPIDFGFKSSGASAGRLRTEFVVPKHIQIEKFCIDEGISRDQLFLGVFQTLLYRYCGQNDFGIAIRQGGKMGLMHLECRGPESFRNLLLRLKRSRPVKVRDDLRVVYYLDGKSDDRHDLELGFEKKGTGLVGVICASEGVFFQKSIEDMGAHFVRVLESVVKDSDTHLNDLEFLSDEEETLLYHTFADGEKVSYPNDVRDIFSEVVGKRGKEIAIEDEKGAMTYQELDESSNRMANCLMEKGIGVGDVVGISSHHDSRLLVVVIALVKLGATYLPLDPSYPKMRIHGMICDAKPKIVLYEEDLKAINVEAQSKSKKTVRNVVDPDGTAYIIFTSGSTGRPKGIEIANRSLPHLSLERMGFYPKETRSLLIGSIGFDISFLMIFHTLMTGGTLCIPDEAKRVDGVALLKFIDEHQLNYMMCVPSFYAMILEKNISLPESLEIVSLVGEQIPLSLPALHEKLGSHVKLYNEYGPCEVAIGSNYALIYDAEEKVLHPITVGKPLPNTHVYVLSPSLLLTSLPQMKGEICIGGVGVAKGYLNREKLTKEKFVTIKLPRGETKKVYCTGDFGRYLPNGNLEFLGRMDYQIKLRGHRIELGEIENVLRRQEQIDEVAVVQNEDGFLVAYYSTILEDPLSKEVVKGYLEKHLPTFMIPTHYMQLKKFPRTLIQKIDRKALPKISKEKVDSKKSVTTNSVENKLIGIWKEVLKTESVSLSENFFDLGGNSLLLASVQTRIKEVFGIFIPMIEFFGASTAKDFAKLIREQLIHQAGDS